MMPPSMPLLRHAGHPGWSRATITGHLGDLKLPVEHRPPYRPLATVGTEDRHAGTTSKRRHWGQVVSGGPAYS
jgi:hypothetical protein